MVVGGRGGEGDRGSGVCIPGEGRQEVRERERERGGKERFYTHNTCTHTHKFLNNQ